MPDPENADHPEARSHRELRRISDAQTLRALTHPTRIALIELLTVEGPHTATEAAEKVGESPSSCSFHLRQLERYGFIEAAGGGTGRRRPWKMAQIGMTISTENDEDPAAGIAASALLGLIRTRQIERYETWRRTRGGYPSEWRTAAIDSEFGFWLTAEELQALGDRMTAELMELVRDRLGEHATRPPGALPVEMLLLAFPVAPPDASAP
jgi:predicted transcriptional regulator